MSMRNNTGKEGAGTKGVSVAASSCMNSKARAAKAASTCSSGNKEPMHWAGNKESRNCNCYYYNG